MYRDFPAFREEYIHIQGIRPRRVAVTMFEDETIAEEVDTGQGSRRNGNVQTHASGSHVTNRKLTGEQEPLLGSGSGVGTEPVDEDGDGEGSDSEWKGVPWWKQPSVSNVSHQVGEWGSCADGTFGDH